ncbi:hypothetical protein F5148DRAFT_1334964, partial [Russula earlei]
MVTVPMSPASAAISPSPTVVITTTSVSCTSVIAPPPPNGPSPSPSLSSRRLCFTCLRHYIYAHRHRPCILSPAHLSLSFTPRTLSSTTGRHPCFAHDCHSHCLTLALAHRHLCHMQFSTHHLRPSSASCRRHTSPCSLVCHPCLRLTRSHTLSRLTPLSPSHNLARLRNLSLATRLHRLCHSRLALCHPHSLRLAHRHLSTTHPLRHGSVSCHRHALSLVRCLGRGINLHCSVPTICHCPHVAHCCLPSVCHTPRRRLHSIRLHHHTATTSLVSPTASPPSATTVLDSPDSSITAPSPPPATSTASKDQEGPEPEHKLSLHAPPQKEQQQQPHRHCRRSRCRRCRHHATHHLSHHLPVHSCV